MDVKRWVGLFVVVALLVVGFVAYSQPQLFPTDVDLARLIYMLLLLVLLSGAAFGFGRLRAEPGKALWAILFWGGLILAIMALYQVFN